MIVWDDAARHRGAIGDEAGPRQYPSDCQDAHLYPFIGIVARAASLGLSRVQGRHSERRCYSRTLSLSLENES